MVEMNQERLELLYEPCQSKAELKQHIKTFLNIDMPDTHIDELSNSDPMECIWSIYYTMMTDLGPHRVVVASSRNSMKTLSAAIIRFYGMIHFRRSGTHLAATADQSKSLTNYLEKFLSIPGVREYIDISNTREKTLKNMPDNGFTVNRDCTLRIAVATKAGVNSQRGSFNTRDELELIPNEILAESAFIADPTNDQHSFSPVEMELSSRKIADGPMQGRIDEAESLNPPEDLRLHKWSMVDFMKKCPEEVYRPDLPKETAFLNTDKLDIIWNKEQYESLDPGAKVVYKQINAYHGCKTCPAFIACQARAPKQTGTSKSLRDRNFVGLVLKSVKDPDAIVSQALNWRPGKSGNVFKMLRKDLHYRKPIDFYRWCIGRFFIPAGMTEEMVMEYIGTEDEWKVMPSKEDIFSALQSNNWDINYGVDWGYDPAKATCIVTAYNKRQDRAAIFHVAYSQHMANKDWANYIIDNIWSIYPGDLVCPDMADPASPSYFKKVACMRTKPPKIDTGVSQLRGLLFDPVYQKERMIILNDGSEEMDEYYRSMEKWTHRKTPLGFDFNKYEDNDYCDFIDPTRYALDPFIKNREVTMSGTQPETEEQARIRRGREMSPGNATPEQLQEIGKQELQKHFSEHGLGNVFSKEEKLKALKEVERVNKVLKGKNPDDDKDPNPSPPKPAKGKLKFSF